MSMEPQVQIAPIAREFSIDENTLRMVSSRVSGAVFRSGSEKYLKIQEVWGGTPDVVKTMFEERLSFWTAMAHETGIALPAFPTRSGSYALLCDLDGRPAIATCGGYVEGTVPRPSSGVWDEAILRELGRIAGAFHRFATTYPVWRRITPEPEALHGARSDAPVDDFDLVLQSVIRRCVSDGARRELDEIARVIRSTPITRANHGFTHMDLQHGNLIGTGTKAGLRWWLIDPDLAVCTWFVVDLAYSIYPAVAATYTRDGEGVAALSERPDLAGRMAAVIKPYLDGYRSQRRLERSDLELLGPQIRYCDVQAATYILTHFDVDDELSSELAFGVQRFAAGDRSIDLAVEEALEEAWR
jgi:Ser/Thr protein kinase RdoA (MazF antagonist)